MPGHFRAMQLTCFLYVYTTISVDDTKKHQAFQAENPFLYLILLRKMDYAFSLGSGVEGSVASCRTRPVKILVGRETAGISRKGESTERLEVVGGRWRR